MSPTKPRLGAPSPILSPSNHQNFTSFTTSVPAQKVSPFWASMPISPTGRPCSYTEQSDMQSRVQSQNRRHSAHSKELDRISTCSSTSEHSLHSTHSNGVRAQLQQGLVLLHLHVRLHTNPLGCLGVELEEDSQRLMWILTGVDWLCSATNLWKTRPNGRASVLTVCCQPAGLSF